MSRIVSALSLGLLLCYFILSHRFFLVDPPIHPDEVFFAASAIHQQRFGYPAVTLYGDQPLSGQHIRNYAYPPLYGDIVATVFSLSEQRIVALRLLSVLFGSVILIVLFFTLRSVSRSNAVALLGCAAVLLYGPFGLSTRVGRMEILVLLLSTVGFYSVLVLTRKRFSFLLAGSTIGAAMITHPAGMYLSALFVLFLIGQGFLKLRRLNKYLFAPVCFALCYWFIRIADMIPLFIHQMTIQFAFKTERISIIEQLFQNFLHWRIFLLIYCLVIFLLFIFGFFYKKRILFVLGSYEFFVLFGVWKGIEQWYLVYLIVPLILSLAWLATEGKRWGRYLSIVFLVILCTIWGSQLFAYSISERKTNQSYAAIVDEITKYVSPDQKILISMIPDPTFGLWERGYTQVFALEHISAPGSLESVLDSSDVLLINYVTNNEVKYFLNQLEAASYTEIFIEGVSTTIVQVK